MLTAIICSFIMGALLTIIIVSLTYIKKDKEDDTSHLYEEIEILENIIDEQYENYANAMKVCREETIKEFAEKLKSHYDNYDDYDDIYAYHIIDDIDFLVENMTEEIK